jgi:ABC-type sugar transport system substrate-binding protein
MKRREFITLLGGAVAWPLPASAQQTPKLPTIGFLSPTTASVENQRVAAFVQRLRELGWIEGRTVGIKVRWAEGRSARAAEIVAEFVRQKVDVIVSRGTVGVLAAKHATSVIPIVFAGGDPVGTGFIVSLAPGVAMSRTYRSSRPILLANDSNFCARLSLVFAGERYWPMPAIPSPCGRCVRLRRRPARSASR